MRPLIRDAFAFETTVANEIRGIGVDIYDASRDFGSAGRLRSLVDDGLARQVSRTIRRRSSSARTTRSACSGRRSAIAGWRSCEFRDRTAASEALLGRDQAHWSFFFDPTRR